MRIRVMTRLIVPEQRVAASVACEPAISQKPLGAGEIVLNFSVLVFIYFLFCFSLFLF